jgi:hypothetical protein
MIPSMTAASTTVATVATAAPLAVNNTAGIIEQPQPETITPWDATPWREAAVEYHRDRPGRLAVEIEPKRLARLRRLMTDDVSLERAWHELNRRDGAPAATTEALMFSLRERGVQTLSEPDTQRRLSELNDAQLREVAVRLQKLKAKIARAWTPKDVAVLIAARRRLK